MRRSWCRNCLLACSACILIEPRTTNLEWYHPQCTAPPHQSPIKKMLYRLAYSPVSWRQFLNWDSFLSDEDSLCQVDRKLTNTMGCLLERWLLFAKYITSILVLKFTLYYVHQGKQAHLVLSSPIFIEVKERKGKKRKSVMHLKGVQEEIPLCHP